MVEAAHLRPPLTGMPYIRTLATSNAESSPVTQRVMPGHILRQACGDKFPAKDLKGASRWRYEPVYQQLIPVMTSTVANSKSPNPNLTAVIPIFFSNLNSSSR